MSVLDRINKELILKELTIAVNDNANYIDDKINWDYVSADLYMALGPDSPDENDLIDETLEQFATYFEEA